MPPSIGVVRDRAPRIIMVLLAGAMGYLAGARFGFEVIPL